MNIFDLFFRITEHTITGLFYLIGFNIGVLIVMIPQLLVCYIAVILPLLRRKQKWNIHKPFQVHLDRKNYPQIYEILNLNANVTAISGKFTESAYWFNVMLSAVWGCMYKEISKLLKNLINNEIDDLRREPEGSFLFSTTCYRLEFGSIAPILEDICIVERSVRKGPFRIMTKFKLGSPLTLFVKTIVLPVLLVASVKVDIVHLSSKILFEINTDPDRTLSVALSPDFELKVESELYINKTRLSFLEFLIEPVVRFILCHIFKLPKFKTFFLNDKQTTVTEGHVNIVHLNESDIDSETNRNLIRNDYSFIKKVVLHDEINSRLVNKGNSKRTASNRRISTSLKKDDFNNVVGLEDNVYIESDESKKNYLVSVRDGGKSFEKFVCKCFFCRFKTLCVFIFNIIITLVTMIYGGLVLIYVYSMKIKLIEKLVSIIMGQKLFKIIQNFIMKRAHPLMKTVIVKTLSLFRPSHHKFYSFKYAYCILSTSSLTFYERDYIPVPYYRVGLFSIRYVDIIDYKEQVIRIVIFGGTQLLIKIISNDKSSFEKWLISLDTYFLPNKQMNNFKALLKESLKAGRYPGQNVAEFYLHGKGICTLHSNFKYDYSLAFSALKESKPLERSKNITGKRNRLFSTGSSKKDISINEDLTLTQSGGDNMTISSKNISNGTDLNFEIYNYWDFDLLPGGIFVSRKKKRNLKKRMERFSSIDINNNCKSQTDSLLSINGIGDSNSKFIFENTSDNIMLSNDLNNNSNIQINNDFDNDDKKSIVSFKQTEKVNFNVFNGILKSSINTASTSFSLYELEQRIGRQNALIHQYEKTLQNLVESLTDSNDSVTENHILAIEMTISVLEESLDQMVNLFTRQKKEGSQLKSGVVL